MTKNRLLKTVGICLLGQLVGYGVVMAGEPAEEKGSIERKEPGRAAKACKEQVERFLFRGLYNNVRLSTGETEAAPVINFDVDANQLIDVNCDWVQLSYNSLVEIVRGEAGGMRNGSTNASRAPVRVANIEFIVFDTEYELFRTKKEFVASRKGTTLFLTQYAPYISKPSKQSGNPLNGVPLVGLRQALLAD